MTKQTAQQDGQTAISALRRSGSVWRRGCRSRIYSALYGQTRAGVGLVRAAYTMERRNGTRSHTGLRKTDWLPTGCRCRNRQMEVTGMADIRACGLGWVYCDGNCSTCQKTTTTATTSTTPPNFVTGTSHYPVSNADRIRAMSDEELMGYMYHNCHCPPELDELPSCPYRKKNRVQTKDCRTCWLDWLKQEVDSDPT